MLPFEPLALDLYTAELESTLAAMSDPSAEVPAIDGVPTKRGNKAGSDRKPGDSESMEHLSSRVEPKGFMVKLSSHVALISFVESGVCGNAADNAEEVMVVVAMAEVAVMAGA